MDTPIVEPRLMLADHAQVENGKLFITGGSWNIIAMPGPVPYAIGGTFRVPWEATNRQHRVVLRLMDADGNQVHVPQPNGGFGPVTVDGSLEAGRPPGIPNGTVQQAPFAMNIVHGQLKPGRYVWSVTIDGKSGDDWDLPFTVVAGQAVPLAS